jgi:anti-repressor protein
MTTDNNTFSLELAQEIVESEQQFPINFDLAWQWLGYSSKQKCKAKLENNFEKELDYLTKRVKNATIGRPSDSVFLSVDCFKSLAMMAGTEKGKKLTLSAL